MKLRVLFVMPALVLVLFLSALPASASVTTVIELGQSTVIGTDIDGIAARFDPDVNDEMFDWHDPAPINLALTGANSTLTPQFDTSLSDFDGDGLADDLDPDDDGDGVGDIDDPEPNNPAVPGSSAPPASQPGTGVSDLDSDGLADDLDPDDDNDGVGDVDDPEPNNPAVPGSSAPPAPQPGTDLSDVDGDGLADDLDPDDDNDGVADIDDLEPFNPAVPGSAPPSVPVTEAPPSNPGTQPQETPTVAVPEPSTGVPPAATIAPEPITQPSFESPAPVVTALPSTGTGSTLRPYLAVAMSVLVVAAAGTITVHLRIRSTV